MGKLKGRRLLVTGAASGVGREVTKAFAREDAMVAVFDRDVAGLKALEEIAAASFVVDLRDSARLVECVANAAESLGGLNGIVSVAGVHVMASLENTSNELWDLMIAVNLTAPMVIARAALPWLKQSGAATIVNVSSGSALYPVPMRSAYIASKGGLVALSKALALELAPAIRVNCVCPGAVDTPMLRDGMPDELYEKIGSSYALQRVAAPREIADAIVYLTSQESSFVTGIALAVDGGRTFH